MKATTIRILTSPRVPETLEQTAAHSGILLAHVVEALARFGERQSGRGVGPASEVLVFFGVKVQRSLYSRLLSSVYRSGVNALRPHLTADSCWNAFLRTRRS